LATTLPPKARSKKAAKQQKKEIAKMLKQKDIKTVPLFLTDLRYPTLSPILSLTNFRPLCWYFHVHVLALDKRQNAGRQKLAKYFFMV
jgi:hypothetical protein